MEIPQSPYPRYRKGSSVCQTSLHAGTLSFGTAVAPMPTFGAAGPSDEVCFRRRRGHKEKPRETAPGLFIGDGSVLLGWLFAVAAAPALRIDVTPRIMHIAPQLAPFFLRHLPAARCGSVPGPKLCGMRRRSHARRRAGAVAPMRRTLLSLVHALHAGTVAAIGRRTLLSLGPGVESQ